MSYIVYYSSELNKVVVSAIASSIDPETILHKFPSNAIIYNNFPDQNYINSWVINGTTTYTLEITELINDSAISINDVSFAILNASSINELAQNIANLDYSSVNYTASISNNVITFTPTGQYLYRYAKITGPGSLAKQSTASIDIDLTKAKTEKRDKLRSQRSQLFQSLDKLYIEAQSKKKDLTSIKNRQQYLRDLPNSSLIDSAASVTDLDQIQISEWEEPNMDSLSDDISLISKSSDVITIGSTEKIILSSDVIVNGRVLNKLQTTTITGANAVLTAAYLKGGVILRNCESSNKTDTFDTAANIISSLNLGAGDSYEFLIRNISSSYKILTVVSSTGVTLNDVINISSNRSKRFLMVVTSISPAAITIYNLNDVERTVINGNFINVFSSNNKYIIWNNNSIVDNNVVNGLWIGRAGRVVEINTLYIYTKGISATNNTIVHFDIGKLNGNNPNNDMFTSLLDSAVTWNVNTLTGTYPDISSGAINVPFDEGTKLSVRIREIGNVTQSKADVNINLVIELY